MSNGTLSYKLGGDASGLREAFASSLRFAGSFSENLKKQLSIRGLFEGIGGALQKALGGSTFGEVFGNALKGSLGKEVNEMRFGAMLGEDAAKAAPLLRDLGALAREAAVETSGLNDEAARLAGYQMNAARIAETLRMLTDITKITGGSTQDLAEVYGRAFRDGVVGSRELLELSRSNVNVLGELEKITGKNKEQLVEMGGQGKITFDLLEQAFKNLTSGTGQYANGVARYAGTTIGMAQQIRAEFSRIPTAFFSGIIGDGLGAAKGTMAEILETVRGWVGAAQNFGKWIAAAVQTARGLFAEGGWAKIGPLIGDALMVAVGGAVSLLVRGFAAAAMGLGHALAGIFSDLGDVISGKIGALFGKEDDGPSAAKMAEHFTQNMMIGGIKGWKMTEGVDLGKDARNRIAKAFTPGMAAQLLPAQIAAGLAVGAGGPLAALGIAGNLDQLGDKNAPGKGGVPSADRVKLQTDRLSSIGLYVGAGGPQAEAHAKATAKHTETTAKAVQQVAANTAGLPALAPGKFGGRAR
jgi:tape measure domain-containing protein